MVMFSSYSGNQHGSKTKVSRSKLHILPLKNPNFKQETVAQNSTFHGLSFQLHVSICQHFTKSDPGPIHQVTSKLSGMHCIFPPNRGPRFVLDVSDLEAPGDN